MSERLCECGSPALLIRWPSGTTTPTCEASMATYRARYGEPKALTIEQAP